MNGASLSRSKLPCDWHCASLRLFWAGGPQAQPQSSVAPLRRQRLQDSRVRTQNLRYFSIFPFPDVVGSIRLLTLGVFVGIFVAFKALIG